ncbi:MAG TPA: DNA recombination protein RmuC [Actinomycetales bacterium]|nr:DNA recombination protein RmuC [Actinomycetales bacterium]
MDMWTAVLAAGVVGLLLGGVVGAVGALRFVRGRSVEPDDDNQLALALAPLSSTLARVERQVGALERDRIDQFARLDAQLTAVQSSGEALRAQTAALAGALRSPNARGAWGEVQLRRVVEHAGMLQRVDFSMQATGTNAEGRQVRPDAVVHLPGGKHVVVDAKAPLAAFLDASQAIVDGEDATFAAERLWSARRQHAAALRQHVDALAAKQYWTAFDPAPELVVCFVPGESFLAAACEADPSLLEHAMARKVVLATPTTLLTMLRTVALTWQQDALAGNARELFDVGRELYRRLGGLGGHVERLGRALHRAVEDYNGMVGSLERRVLVTARRMHDLEVTDDLLPGLDPVESTPRPLTAAELIDRAS